jgi:hypothetical protein
LRGVRVLLRRFVLLKALSFVFSSCWISQRLLFWVRRVVSWILLILYWWFSWRCWSRRWLWGLWMYPSIGRSCWCVKLCHP